MNTATITIHGEKFVIIPEREFDRLRGIPEGSVEAIPFAMQVIGDDLRKARETAGMTQVQLAKKMKRSQSFIASVETGATQVGIRYINAVLKACGLPEDWKA